jgi:hypothetical protein
MNPEELLQQLVPLLQQYLSSGGDPAALEAAMASGGGGGAPAGGGMPPMPGGMPPEAGMEDPMMMSGEVPVPDMTGAPGGDFSSFGEASAALEEDMKRKRTKGAF